MAYRRNLANSAEGVKGPTAPRKRYLSIQESEVSFDGFLRDNSSGQHPLTDEKANKHLQAYESQVKGRFERIVPLLMKISSLQHEEDFVSRAQKLTASELGFELPTHVLEKAWVSPLNMRALFAWCVFQTHQETSNSFFNSDPLHGAEKSNEAKAFQSFLNDCGFHLLDITPCSDGRLAHSVAYVLRIPFSAVRRRSHAGALFDIEQTVNRWVKTEHQRYRENLPTPATAPTRYLKVVTYHFSSLDPLHQGCAAHGSNDSVAAAEGLNRLLGFRKAIENSFCCGASVDLLLIGLDTDTDAIRVHVPSFDTTIDLDNWICTSEIYRETQSMSADLALDEITRRVQESAKTRPDEGMVAFIARLIANNISQIDYVRQNHGGHYPDAGHAEKFIGVGIGFKEVHLRNLTYFSHLDTVEEGSPDLDVGIKIFKGLNVSRDLPIPVVIRFDYSGTVPGARDRAMADCRRVDEAISARYRDLVDEGLLHTFLTIRDRDEKSPAEPVGSSLDPSLKEAH
ncbi:carboxysome shell carbonic anhydrase [Prochlorococcus sp. MIT 1341]|uniref:carboxysome shell carbonic anhydrase n=1 Tax=Prochlorococcus sp. MIT 1341 TaxID=3096221 RepID=UPI002A75351C|nr:carboxysome shell carbonic anhydrase [Prochlorococcus sp. MIT 1341]